MFWGATQLTSRLLLESGVALSPSANAALDGFSSSWSSIVIVHDNSRSLPPLRSTTFTITS